MFCFTSETDFQGKLVLPGNKKDLDKLSEKDGISYVTWIDKMMGPTFVHFIHLLTKQTMKNT